MSLLTMGRRGGRATALVSALVLAGSLAACSSTGGAQQDDTAAQGGGGGDKPTTMKVAMITHGAAGDTFWDTIRKGAEAAAANDGVDLQYSSDGDANNQATLIQNAIDAKVDAIAVTSPNTGALGAPIQAAIAAGIPVTMFNAGANDWKTLGALSYFGQDEAIAGEAAGERLKSEGAQKVLCVIQAQGQSQLEARCDGVSKGLGTDVERLYINGTDLPQSQSTISSKLQQDPSIDHVITLGGQFALAAVQAKGDAGSQTKVVTFDNSADVVKAIQSGDVGWAIDQQPYAQGYLAVDSLWMNKNAGIVLGGGQPVLTGPAFVDSTNVDATADFAAQGLR
ncbi:substrate-binding domain-containing protein [Quadrisphaera sp. INWT6]|uniref:substrate-binding domain-containing protein n=1 Tax=Quadrisphaera sp. INWT6 TaxID=2596917 RepID=UPI00189222E4|nr:substrate-binding domain-containing protein [Quadrisphaera sp. INWT6]MBF5083184.1 sugar ABC transporter substrate-binding protein [Quadrisphaera sp. INWT6]